MVRMAAATVFHSGNDGNNSNWGTPVVIEHEEVLVLPDYGEERRLAELSEEVVTAPTFHVEARLPNGKPALLLDIGSVGNPGRRCVGEAAIRRGNARRQAA